MTDQTTDTAPRYQIANLHDIAPVDCPCGKSRRAFLEDPDRLASLHVVQIQKDSRTHYHKSITELYYVLEGEGQIELDGSFFDIRPGNAILIKPGCRHRAIGELRLLIVPIPAFDTADEWFD